MTLTINPKSIISKDAIAVAYEINHAIATGQHYVEQHVTEAAKLVEVRRQTDQVVEALQRIDNNIGRIADALERLAPPVVR